MQIFLYIPQVYDGAVDTFGTIGIYCGTEPPGVIISKYNLVYIHFHSDESLTGSGFLATYFSFYCTFMYTLYVIIRKM